MYLYWGKTNKANDYHLLVYHCLDVAAVANGYLGAHPEFLETMAKGFQLDIDITKRLILICITLHDLGKFSICFQAKNEKVLVLLDPLRKARESNYHHDVLGNAIWKTHIFSIIRDYIKKREGLYISSVFNALMNACTGHHGKPPVDISENHVMMAFDKQDIEAAKEFSKYIINLFLDTRSIDLSHYAVEDELTESFNRVSWWLSGLTILADWLGSNTDYFPYQQEPISLNEYWLQAQQKALLAIEKSGLNKVQIAKQQTYQTIFNLTSPRPLQEYAGKISLYNEPQLFILEDMTGAGKTEAALMLAYRMLENSSADGIYFALPTMATANGIYERLVPIYKKFFALTDNVSIILAHANSKNAKPFRDAIQTKLGAEDKYLAAELNTATAYCNAWFTDNRKKALLATMGVGTIDQALQSILPNRHQSLRLLGLFRKILIVDEVHACDSYMLELLKTLVTFHTAAGGSTILLSATLPQKMRTVLTAAFYRSLTDFHTENTEINNNYPLATYCRINSLPTTAPIAALPELTRQIEIQLTDEIGIVEKMILEKLNRDLCVCWIRNTVHDAVVAYKKLAELYSPEKIILFHARFTMHDRYELENKIKRFFDKNSSVEDRQGMLVIATQVVEQSLDIDFDFMVSDLAPIDLVIQRMGRLQRHMRMYARPQPLLLVYGPLPVLEADSDWYSKILPKGARVYVNHAQLWLTAKLLQQNAVIQIPEHVRAFVEYVYNEDSLTYVPDAVRIASAKAEGKSRGNSENAKMVALQLEHGYKNSKDIRWCEDIYAPTRLSEQQSLNVCLVKWDGKVVSHWHAEDNFSPEMSHVNIPEHYLPKDAPTITHPLLEHFAMDAVKKKNQAFFIWDEEQQSWFALKQEEENLEFFKLKQIIYSKIYGLLKFQQI